jgi:hypothetical protein
MEKSESKLDVNGLTLAISFIFGFICCAIFSNIAYNRMIERVNLLETRNANLQMILKIAVPLDKANTKGKRIK